MNETSLRLPEIPEGYSLSPDDAPSNHSSVPLVIPKLSRRSFPGRDRLFTKAWEAPDSTFRDAQEYQGRAQDIAESGITALPPDEGYNSKPDLGAQARPGNS